MTYLATDSFCEIIINFRSDQLPRDNAIFWDNSRNYGNLQIVQIRETSSTDRRIRSRLSHNQNANNDASLERPCVTRRDCSTIICQSVVFACVQR